MHAKSRNAHFLLIGDGFSTFGSWIDFLAILTLAAYTYHVSPYQMAVISAAGLLPGILCAPFIGRLCDHSNPKLLLLMSLVFRVLATAGILFAPNYALFIVFFGIRSVFASFLLPAVNVMAVRAIAPAGRPRFYSSLNVINSVAKVIAPMVGTISSSVQGEAFALMMSACLSAVSFLIFLFVELSVIVPQDPLATDCAATAAKIPISTSIIPLLYLGSIYAFYVHMINNLVPVILKDAGHDKSLLGILVGCAGAGNILSGLWLARQKNVKALVVGISDIAKPALIQAAGFGLMGQIIALHTPWSTVMLAILFFAIGIFATRHGVSLSLFTSDRYANVMGTATATLQSFQNIMLLVAPLIGAFLLEHWGSKILFAAAMLFAIMAYGALGLLILLRSHAQPAAHV